MAVTIEMIETKEFKVIARGYDPKEVDGFLDDIMDEMARLMDEKQSLQQQLAAAKAAAAAPAAATQVVRPVQASPYAAPKAAAPAAPSKDALEILEMAQKLKNETLEKAQAEAQEILAKAQEKADEQLKDLSGDKETLTRQVADLRAAAAEYRKNFEALLQAQQEAIEKASNLF
ncbi:MAG: DivIVA domain-containing protein [Clostridia bacterium]|nr:DivIVA domain-containing protein [Clostridia bacterium]